MALVPPAMVVPHSGHSSTYSETRFSHSGQSINGTSKTSQYPDIEHSPLLCCLVQSSTLAKFPAKSLRNQPPVSRTVRETRKKPRLFLGGPIPGVQRISSAGVGRFTLVRSSVTGFVPGTVRQRAVRVTCRTPRYSPTRKIGPPTVTAEKRIPYCSKRKPPMDGPTTTPGWLADRRNPASAL